MPDALIIAAIGFLSAVAGGMLQAWTSRRLETSRFQQNNRNQAYLSFCSGIGRLSFALDYNEDHLRALAAVAEARFLVALYGSQPVIEAMIRVVAHADVRSPAAQREIATMIAAMRQDCLPDSPLTDCHQLYVLTYGDPVEVQK